MIVLLTGMRSEAGKVSGSAYRTGSRIVPGMNVLSFGFAGRSQRSVRSVIER